MNSTEQAILLREGTQQQNDKPLGISFLCCFVTRMPEVRIFRDVRLQKQIKPSRLLGTLCIFIFVFAWHK